ncbi:hypothetical protein RNH31_002538 [Salmonella enterica]|nr:hypothetical protein [Salmonella enterica]
MNILPFAIGLIVGAAGVAVSITIIFRKKKRKSLKQKLTPHMPEFHESMDSALSKSKALLSSADYLYAIENGALAATWHTSKFACNVPSHQDRDLQTFAIQNSWGLKKGLVRPNANGFLDDLSLPRCGCYLTYLYNLGSLPPEMLTKKYAKLSKKTK